MPGPTGPRGYNGTQGPQGLSGPAGPPGPSGSGNLSQCAYTKKQGTQVSSGAYASADATATETTVGPVTISRPGFLQPSGTGVSGGRPDPYPFFYKKVASSKNCTQFQIKVNIPYPFTDQNGQNLYPISDQNGSKNVPFGAAHTMAKKGVLPRGGGGHCPLP